MVPFLSLLLVFFSTGDPESCSMMADCADLDGDGLRDDPCVWWDCAAGACVAHDLHYGDMVGSMSQCFCQPDGAPDGNDFGYGLLSCFGGSNPCGCDPMQFDIGSRYLACVPDGVCDINDSFHAHRVFDRLGSPCSCPLDGSRPEVPRGNPVESHTGQDARLFMRRAGGPVSAPAWGSANTLMHMAPGSTATVVVWLADERDDGPPVETMQLVVEDAAVPQDGAVGAVSYVEDGRINGGSVTLDTLRADFLFADTQFTGLPVYTERPEAGVFGLIYFDQLGEVIQSQPGQNYYLMHFDLAASPDASGSFELRFARDPIPGVPRPLTDLFYDLGHDYGLSVLHNLTIVVNDCTSLADCADLDGNGIRDDVCTSWSCAEGECLGTPIVQADMAGQFGACAPDGAADGNDRFMALACFAGEWIADACEDDPPAAFNVDAGASFGLCVPDGFCDGNDAFHVLNAFAGTSSCTCPLNGGPAPDPAAPGDPVAVAELALVPSVSDLRPGGRVSVDVVLATALADLRGYQLHLQAGGGMRGRLELIDIVIEDDPAPTWQRTIEARHQGFAPAARPPTVERRVARAAQQAARTALPDRALPDGRNKSTARIPGYAPVWSAFNRERMQMLAGTDGPGIATAAHAYLATFVFRASPDARGTFTIDLLADHTDPSQRTFLFATDPRAVIAIESPGPVVVEVVPEK